MEENRSNNGSTIEQETANGEQVVVEEPVRELRYVTADGEVVTVVPSVDGLKDSVKSRAMEVAFGINDAYASVSKGYFELLPWIARAQHESTYKAFEGFKNTQSLLVSLTGCAKSTASELCKVASVAYNAKGELTHPGYRWCRYRDMIDLSKMESGDREKLLVAIDERATKLKSGGLKLLESEIYNSNLLDGKGVHAQQDEQKNATSESEEQKEEQKGTPSGTEEGTGKEKSKPNKPKNQSTVENRRDGDTESGSSTDFTPSLSEDAEIIYEMSLSELDRIHGTFNLIRNKAHSRLKKELVEEFDKALEDIKVAMANMAKWHDIQVNGIQTDGQTTD